MRPKILLVQGARHVIIIFSIEIETLFGVISTLLIKKSLISRVGMTSHVILFFSISYKFRILTCEDIETAIELYIKKTETECLCSGIKLLSCLDLVRSLDR